MKKTLLGYGLVFVSLLSNAGERIDQSLDAASNGYVKIIHVNGELQVKGWDKDLVQVQGELGDATKKFIFERNGDEILLKIKVKNNTSGRPGDDLVVYVPKDSRVKYHTVNAEFRISQVYGGVDAESVNGEINAKDLQGRTHLTAVNGEIIARQLTGDLSMETVNGDIRVTDSQGKQSTFSTVNGEINVQATYPQVSAGSVNGGITLRLQQVTRLNLETVNGDTRAYMHLLPQGEITANSVGGDINLYMQPDVSARFDIESHAGGDIYNELSEHRRQKAKYGSRRWLEFAINGGQAKVALSSVSGDISLQSKD